MIDMLVLRVPFLPEHRLVQVDDLPITRDFRKDSEGNITNVRHSWESIPSSYHSLAVKINIPQTDSKIQYHPFVEIKASPAKLMLGHNVFGSDSLEICAYELMLQFAMYHDVIIEMLDIINIDVAGIDVTYASFADNHFMAKQTIAFLNNISHSQTKAAQNQYDTTAYFGAAKSRLKRIKVYLKENEVYRYLEGIKKNRKMLVSKKQLIAEQHTDEVKDFSKNMIRWEATVKKRWLERNDYPTKLSELIKVFDAKDIWLKATNDIFESFRGQEMKTVKEDKMLSELNKYFKKRKAKNMYNFYKDIMTEGYAVATSQEYISRDTLSRYIRDFKLLGISKAYLQNIKINENINVVPLVRFTSVDFGQQVPEFFDMEKFETDYFKAAS